MGVPWVDDLIDQRDKLQAFKDWCHAYLDGKGIPHHPPGTHGAEGCRIGDRMDYVFAALAAAREQVTALAGALENALNGWKYDANQGDGILEMVAHHYEAGLAALAAYRANRDAGPGKRAFAPTEIEGANEEFVAKKVADAS